ncbi:MAG: transglycosylase SLT domain-containing protein [Bacteroidales bacterium]|nr:transglycosylase SLT domain-containing protein [Bacteroidales bacterium]
MKRLLCILTAIVLCLQADAAIDFNRIFHINQPHKKDLAVENERLRVSLDSLSRIVDSLRAERIPQSSELGEVMREMEDTVEYSPEVTDSLLDIWMQSRRYSAYERVDCDMDSAGFSSNVPDSVMMSRLKAINPFFTLPFNSTVKNYMILYSEKMPQTTARLLGLSEYYMPILEQTFAKYNLPLELKYLAVIESALNPTARSRAGAMGMWQFMYTTARSYGLKINSFMDERLDVEKSADAAARYLRDAYTVFGDWNLAISSYNCGAGNVSKAIRRSGSRNFWDLYDFLPRETRGYVPAMVGAMYAMTYYREYGIEPDDVGMPAAVDTFHIDRNLHFRQINETAGVPMEIIKEFNPQYTHDIIPGSEGTCVLRLPYKWTSSFLDAEADSLYTHLADSLLSPKVLKAIKESGTETRIAYKVKSGDSLGRIAARYHVTVKQLMRWNNLKSTNIRIGKVLYIYRR